MKPLGGFSARISPIVDGDVIWISYLDWNFSEIALYLGKLLLKDPRNLRPSLYRKRTIQDGKASLDLSMVSLRS